MGKLSTYRELSEKEKFFTSYTIDSRSGFEKLSEQLFRDSDSIFRGVCESKFRIYTSLQRFWIEKGLEDSNEEVINYLRHIFNYSHNWQDEFLDRYYQNYKDETLTPLSVFSILRHHGTPTPLLDWTNSGKVALFFAAHASQTFQSEDEIDNYFSVYELKDSHPYHQFDIKEVNAIFFEKHKQLLTKKNNRGNDESYLDTFTEGYINQLEFLDKQIKENKIFKVEDKSEDKIKFHVNNNYYITNQKGLFIFNAHPINPLEVVIRDRAEKLLTEKGISDQQKINEEHRESFVCYNIHKRLREYVLKKLKEDEIDENFIYPKLDQLAQDCVKSYLMN